MSDVRDSSTSETAGQRHTSRRAVLATSIKLIGAGAIVAASPLGVARVAAQDEDEGVGAGGRQGGDGGGGGGGGRRRQQDDQAAPEGVGAGGRTAELPAVDGMPSTGVGDTAGSITPLLLAAGAVGAATLAMRTRAMPAPRAEPVRPN